MGSVRRVQAAFVGALAISCAAGLIDPVFGHLVLLALSGLFIVREPSRALAPHFIVALFGSAYFVLGGLNISSYRGSIDGEVMLMALFMLCAFSLGALMLGPLASAPRLVFSSRLIDTKVFYVTLIPGVVGLILIASTGFPLIFPGRFVLVSGKAFFLAELLFVPFCIAIANHLSTQGSISRRWLGVSLALVALLALPGYRGWPIIAIVILAVLRWASGRSSVKGLIFAGSAVVALMAGLVVFRRAFDWELSSSAALLADNDAEWLGETIGLLHISFRESIAISQWMIYSASYGFKESLFLSDFMTLLPGARPSGGVVVAESLGVSRGVGLTPGALGALVYEFGPRGYLFVAFGLGMLSGLVCRWCLQRGSALTLCGALLLNIYMIHYLHRGIPKPAYVLIPIALALVFLWTKVSPGRRYRRNLDVS